jgi:hypothetical protein
MEIIRGSLASNEKYCKKDGDYKEFGTLPKQGKRNDLISAIDKHKTLREFMKGEKELYCRYRSGIRDLYALEEEGLQWNDKKVVYYIYGPSGCGKTRKARMECPMPFSLFLKLVDKYANTFNVKGSSCIFDVDILYITSIKSPQEIYANVGESRKQIMRRLTLIKLEDELVKEKSDDVVDLNTSPDYTDPVYDLNRV